jgi:hypothetical protein
LTAMSTHIQTRMRSGRVRGIRNLNTSRAMRRERYTSV